MSRLFEPLGRGRPVFEGPDMTPVGQHHLWKVLVRCFLPLSFNLVELSGSVEFPSLPY